MRQESAEQVTVAVLLFAGVRDAAGTGCVRLTLPAPATAGQALSLLVERFPALAGHRVSLRLAVNSEYVSGTHPLASGDEVALIPPTCGG